MTPAERLAAKKPRRSKSKRKQPWKCLMNDKRLALGLTMRDVADACSITSAMLAGAVPKFAELSEIAACRDVETVRKRPGTPEPILYRTGDGVPDWVDRTRTTGNAVVPQIAEWIGRRIVASLTDAAR